MAITGEKTFAFWTTAAVSAALYAVPLGVARWNLYTIAPLVWWQVGLAAFLGTALSLPYLHAMTNPAVAYRVSYPTLARVAFGTKGAALVDFLRGVLGLALTTLTALAGGFATERLWNELFYVFSLGELPSFSPAASYAAFALAQTWLSAGKNQGRKILTLGRVAALVAGAYFAWSWNAGDAAVVFASTVARFPAVDLGAAGGGFAGVAKALASDVSPRVLGAGVDHRGRVGDARDAPAGLRAEDGEHETR